MAELQMRIPTPDELRTAYQRDLIEAFPPAELKPLRYIVHMIGQGVYEPLCLYDGRELVGECFLWFRNPGWAMLDYLSVTRTRRNGGFGAYMLRELQRRRPDDVVFVEVEAPDDAPDPPMAARRLKFYARCGARFSGIESSIYGVHYKIIYFAAAPHDDREIRRQYDTIYRKTLPPDQYGRYIQIPRRTAGVPFPAARTVTERVEHENTVF